jgi:hypothetical protein
VYKVVERPRVFRKDGGKSGLGLFGMVVFIVCWSWQVTLASGILVVN